jgi:DNA mismatch endonuclease Vsr
MDTLDAQQRSQRMARIRSKNTKPELAVRSILHALGYRFRIHERGLPGSPDVVFRSRRKVVFVHGCFWHGHDNCKVANTPKTRTKYWTAKFAKNKLRDSENARRLTSDGWNVMIVWECQLKERSRLVSALTSFLGPTMRAT